MSGTRAAIVGLRRALAAPHLVVLVLLVNAAVALPVAWTMRERIQSSIGTRLASERMLEGFDADWHAEWSGRDDGIAETFGPELSGAGFAWRTLEDRLDGGLFLLPPTLLTLGALHAAVWLFLLGGMLDGWARRGTKRGPLVYLRGCRRHWPTLVRLALCSLPLYALVYLGHRELVERLEEATRDLAREMPAIFIVLALYAGTGVLLALVNLWFTAAKVVVVADEARGALRALGRAMLFLLRRAPSAIGVLVVPLALGGVLFAIWALVAPGATASTPTAIAIGFAAGQAFLAAKIGLRLAFHAGMVELYVSHRDALAARDQPEPSPPPSPPAD